MPHLWLTPLDDETIAVFAVAFTLSAKKRGYHVSTHRLLAALPDVYKEKMKDLLEAAACKGMGTSLALLYSLTIREAGLPAPELPNDWQDKITFSTCIESTLHKCGRSGPGTVNLINFLKLLITTAVNLRYIAEAAIPLDLYLTADEAHLTPCILSRITPILARTQLMDREQSHPSSTTPSAEDHLDIDVLHVIMSNVGSIETLRNCKVVCKSWRQAARRTLCDADWLLANQVTLHVLLKKGRPSPGLVVAMTTKRPALLHERDGEGLIPLQYAAACKMAIDLVVALRRETARQSPGCALLNSTEGRSMKSHLRPVQTRVTQGRIAA